MNKNKIMYSENDLNLNNVTSTNQSFLVFLNSPKFNLLNNYLFMKVLWAILLKPHCTKIAWASVNCCLRVANQLIRQVDIKCLPLPTSGVNVSSISNLSFNWLDNSRSSINVTKECAVIFITPGILIKFYFKKTCVFSKRFNIGFNLSSLSVWGK